VVNPPTANKYSYWTNENKPETEQEWFDNSIEKSGSWWADWQTWVAAKAGKKVAARVPGKGKLAVIEAAPGSYVKVRS
jgi:polyhydroxyalkanoate synthase